MHQFNLIFLTHRTSSQISAPFSGEETEAPLPSPLILQNQIYEWYISSAPPPPPPKKKIPKDGPILTVHGSFPFCVLQVKGCLAFYKSLISNAYVWEFPVNTFVNFFEERLSSYCVIWFLVFNREFWVWLKLAPLVRMEIFTPPSCCA